MFLKGIVAGRDYPNDETVRKSNPDKVTHCGVPAWATRRCRPELVSDDHQERRRGDRCHWPSGRSSSGSSAASGPASSPRLFRGRFLDRVLVGVALIFYSFPAFFIAPAGLHLPVDQVADLRRCPSTSTLPRTPASGSRGFDLPWLTLASLYAAGYVRLTRAYMLETMGEDYLRTARAKGVSERVVVMKHTLRAALTPIVTVAGLDLGGLLGGAVDHRDGLQLPGSGPHDRPGGVDLRPAGDRRGRLGGRAFIIVANLSSTCSTPSSTPACGSPRRGQR